MAAMLAYQTIESGQNSFVREHQRGRYDVKCICSVTTYYTSYQPLPNSFPLFKALLASVPFVQVNNRFNTAVETVNFGCVMR